MFRLDLKFSTNFKFITCRRLQEGWLHMPIHWSQRGTFSTQWQRDDVVSHFLLWINDNLLTQQFSENLLLAWFVLIFSLQDIFLFTEILWTYRMKKFFLLPEFVLPVQHQIFCSYSSLNATDLYHDDVHRSFLRRVMQTGLWETCSDFGQGGRAGSVTMFWRNSLYCCRPRDRSEHVSTSYLLYYFWFVPARKESPPAWTAIAQIVWQLCLALLCCS